MDTLPTYLFTEQCVLDLERESERSSRWKGVYRTIATRFDRNASTQQEKRYRNAG